MPFQARSIIPERAYESAKQTAAQLRAFLVSKINEFQSASTADKIIQVHTRIKIDRDRLNTLSQTPGIVAWATEQEAGTQNYDPAAEFTAMIGTLDAILNHIETAIPKDSNGYILDRQFSNNEFEYRSFTAANLSTLRGLMQAAVDGIA